MTSRWLRAGVLLVLPGWLGCDKILPPLKGEIAIGQDAYGIFVGGDDYASDLYAYDPSRHAILPLTYTAVAELAPALAPQGTHVAMLRAGTLRDSMPGTAWVLDLRNGAERELRLPRRTGVPRRIGWRRDGAAIFVAADSGIYRFDAPFGHVKAVAVQGAEGAVADSSFAVLVGEPVFAEVVRCKDQDGLCVVNDSGVPDVLELGAHDPVRWGADSVGYFIRDALEVRPLGPGRARRAEWPNPPLRPRAMTFFPGRPTTPTPPPP